MSPAKSPVGKSAPAPEYGSRLLTTTLDEIARTEPSRAFACIPQSSFIAKGFREVTVKEIANAVNNMAWWIINTIGKPKREFQTFAYMGITDLRYPIVLLAAIKCGYKVLLPSVRNSISMNKSLVEQTECEIFLCSEQYKERLLELAQKVEGLKIETLIVPAFAELLDESSKPFEYTKTYQEALWDPVVVLHSSGSTGTPKCIILNNGSLARVDVDHIVPEVPGRKICNFKSYDSTGDPAKLYLAFPPFHVTGMFFLICHPIYYNSTIVLGPPDRPPTGEVINEILQITKLKGIITPPSILEQFSHEPGSIELAKDVDYVSFAGGPLATSTGNLLNTVTNVQQFYGSTECLFSETMIVDPEDWEYIEFHPLYATDFQGDVDGSCELVIDPHGGAPETQMIPYSMPGVEEWRTNDLFMPHPTKANLWKFHGRKDDIIVMSNGEKMNPVPMENTIQGHPSVSGCIIIGQGRFQSALLIEPTTPTNDAESVINKIWPTVQQANLIAPAHARILRSMVIVSTPDKPFPRTGKGTTLRKKTIELLSSEIDSHYFAGDEGPSQPNSTSPQKTSDSAEQTPQAGAPIGHQPSGGTEAASGIDSVKRLVRAALALAFSGTLRDQDDFYVSGLDSLSTIEIVNTLRKKLRPEHKDADLSWLSTKTIYQHPTIEKLTSLIASQLHLGAPLPTPTAIYNPSLPGGGGDPRVLKMASVVKKFTTDLQNPVPPRSQLTVLLTGSTGGLGSHLLHKLLLDPLVSRIICLNRSADAKTRHQNSLFKDRDLSKVTFLTTQFGHPLFGQKSSTYWELIDSVDIIIHNAWKVDFNHTLESFEEVHLRGVRNFIDFAMKSQRNPHIYFVSSISSCTNLGGDDAGRVPESVPEDYDNALDMGYGESKLVAERILKIAVANTGVKASILRLGQVAGPVEEEGLGGEWTRHEWFPALVKTSKHLGCVPKDLADPDWVPIDMLAGIIVEIIHNSCNVSRVYNLVNPKMSSWPEIAKTMKRSFGDGTREVTLKEWVDMLEVGGSDKADYDTKPALKIMGFYKSMVEAQLNAGLGKLALKYETVHGEAGSRLMAALEGVNPAWMEKWIGQWNF